MKLKKIILIKIVVLLFLISCGKKSSLEKFQDTDYPKNYPKNYDE